MYCGYLCLCLCLWCARAVPLQSLCRVYIVIACSAIARGAFIGGRLSVVVVCNATACNASVIDWLSVVDWL